jgi:predicted amidohydrolase YtcJ
MALELAGITRDSPDPEGGAIGRDETGEPNGILYENAAMGLVQDVMPPLTEEQQLQAISNIGRSLNENGITSVIDANLSFKQMRAYWESYRRGELTYRSRFMFYLDAAAGDVPYHLKRLDEMAAVTGFGDDMVKLNGIKVTLDGIPATGTAYMRRPYCHMPETSGSTTITAEEMKQVALKGASYHWQVGVHTIGDKAVDVALAAFEAAAKEYGDLTENRNYLIHLCFPHDDQLEIMRRLNVSVTTQPTIFAAMGESAILYPDQAAINMAAKPFADKGIVCGGSSDHPVVPCNPFLGMHAAVTRKDTAGVVWGGQYKVSARYALIMWTKASAYFSHDESAQGSIAPGYLADMILVDRDVLAVPDDDIRDAKVLKTFLGGKVVYGGR